jgi:hypothetical protein
MLCNPILIFKYRHKYSQDSLKFLEALELMKTNRCNPSSKHLVNDMRVLYSLHRLPAYKRYRELTQIIDTVILDLESLQHQPQALVLCTLFSVLLMDLKIFKPDELLRGELLLDEAASSNLKTRVPINGSESSIEVHLQQQNHTAIMTQRIRRMDDFVLIFSEFLEQSFGLAYDELEGTREFTCPFSGGIKIAIDQNRRHAPGDLNITHLHYTVRC